VRRLVLRPLSAGAVEELSGGVADAGAVLAATAGNPFFVTEVLANPGVEVPATVQEAAGAGAFSEALAHYQLLLGWSGQLPAEQLATVLEESIWVLYNLSRFDEAVARAGQVVGLRERIGDPATLGQALTTLSRMRYRVNDPAGSEEAVTRAVALLEPLGDRPRLARASTYLAAILKLTTAWTRPSPGPGRPWSWASAPASRT